MQAAGHVPASLDVDRTAAALLAGIQGGVSILLSTGRSTHLHAALDEGIMTPTARCTWSALYLRRMGAIPTSWAALASRT